MRPYPSCAPWHLKFIIIFRLLHAASLSFPAYYISATLQLCHVEIFPLLIRGFLISSSMAFPPLANNATLKYFPSACLKVIQSVRKNLDFNLYDNFEEILNHLAANFLK